MIFFQTKLKVSDNSGAFLVKCIKIFHNPKKKSIIGDKILVTIKKFKKHAKIKRKKIYFGLIIRTKEQINRLNGTSISFNQNNIIIINKDNEPLYNRFVGPITKEFRKTKKKNIKILSLAKNII